MRHKHDPHPHHSQARRVTRRPFPEPSLRDRPGREEDLSEGRDFYGYNFGDYREFEGSDPDADDYGDRGPDWDEEASSSERAGPGYEGSDIRGYEGREVHNYGGGFEGYYGEEQRGPIDYESWRWAARESWGPIGEWSSRHSHDFEHPGFARSSTRGSARPAGPHHPRRRRGFRGIAPKGYSRADSSIYEDVCALLEDDPDIDPSDVTVSVDEREVVLSGAVDDRWTKRYIEDLAYSVRGVSDVVNRLRVEPGEAQ